MERSGGDPILLRPDSGRKLSVLGIDVILKLTAGDTNGGYYLFDSVTFPGTRVPPHVHRHEDEILQVLEGEVEVFLDGRTHTATAGTVVNFPRLVPHGFGNVSSKPCRAVFTVIPGRNFEKFFEELSSLPSNVPPDPARVDEIFRRYDIEILKPPA